MLDEETLGLLLEAISRINTYVRKETAGGTLYRPYYTSSFNRLQTDQQDEIMKSLGRQPASKVRKMRTHHEKPECVSTL